MSQAIYDYFYLVHWLHLPLTVDSKTTHTQHDHWPISPYNYMYYIELAIS